MIKNITDISKDIEDYVNISCALELISKEYQIPFNASPLYNFRDALSHYVELYEATDNTNKITQVSSIEEHLFRGLKDNIVGIVIELKKRVFITLQNEASLKTHTVQKGCRSILHVFKKLEIDIRKNSEASIIRELESFVSRLKDLMIKSKEFYNANQLNPITKKNK